jgi:hypothetical protein
MRLGGTYATNRVLTAGLDNIATRVFRPADTSPVPLRRTVLLGRAPSIEGTLGSKRGASQIEPLTQLPTEEWARGYACCAARATGTKVMERAIDTIRP